MATDGLCPTCGMPASVDLEHSSEVLRRIELDIAGGRYNAVRAVVDRLERESVKRRRNPLKMNVVDLGLSLRIENDLEHAGIITVLDLMKFDPMKVAQLPCIGVLSMRRIYEALEVAGVFQAGNRASCALTEWLAAITASKRNGNLPEHRRKW